MVNVKNLRYRWRLQYTATFLVLIFCFTLAGTAPAEELGESTAPAEYSNSANQCMACHREGRDLPAHEIFMTPMGISGAVDSPFADGKHDCETCHGPSASHRRKLEDGSRPSPAIAFNESTPVATQNEVCQGCHNDSTFLIHWPGSMHNEEEIACASCHTVHTERDPVFDALDQQEVCFSCHPRTRSETFRNSSHPLRFGEMTCTDCHDPHNGSNDFLLKHSTVNDTCYTCHAEKRGPFLWEHAPVTEDCGLCHNPHGSNHAALLKQRPPLLCQQCHAPGGHASKGYTTESAENSFQQRFILGQSCSNCHAQVHGSNHPSGVTITR
jgi:DmsE family decaheme c-type cytochrome